MRRHALLCLLAAAFICSPGSASARLVADSDAPPGADANWLPSEEWVMERWLPFDERALRLALRVDEPGLWADIGRTGRTLDEVATARGVSTRYLAERLVDGRSETGPTSRAVLVARARRVLRQAHLAEHVLFHPFHTWAVLRQAQRVFGVSQLAFDDLLQKRRMSFREIAATGGLSVEQLRLRTLAASRQGARRGVATGAVSEDQFRQILRVDRREFPEWAKYRLPPTAVAAAAARHSAPQLICAVRADSGRQRNR